MLTGVETAGLVLASLPLAISAFEHYKDGCEPLVDWWEFEAVYKRLVQEIDLLRTFLGQFLEKLLSPIVDTDEELQSLLTSPSGDAWRSPNLDGNLQIKLSDSYTIFNNKIEAMNEDMQRLKEKMGVDRADVSSLYLPYFSHSLINALWICMVEICSNICIWPVM